ncbi:putative amino acid/polyamine transporter 2 [Dioscorea sansibarensis]
MKREPGSLTSAIFLVAGTTVGAGILAIPAVTQEAGFLASSVTCILCWIYMVVTGLLITEVNVNTMCELGSGGVSLMGECHPVFSGFWRPLLFWKRLIGAVNGVLVIGILASFATLVNVVPVLCTNLEGNQSKVRTSIVLGTAIPLILFLIWDAVILGTIPNLELNGVNVTDPLQRLRSNNGIVGPIVEVFSFLAIATSYIGFVLGLTDFIADLLKLPSGQNKPLPYLLTLFPPLVLALLDPEIFFKALDFAGTYGVLVLFGLIPAAMSWSERYSSSSLTPKIPPVVPGGKLTLSITIGGATFVILSEILKNVHA